MTGFWKNVTYFQNWQFQKQITQFFWAFLFWNIDINITDNHIKAKLQKEGKYFFLIHLFARDILLMKNLEIEETKTT